jgi:hypothetical protein
MTIRAKSDEPTRSEMWNSAREVSLSNTSGKYYLSVSKVQVLCSISLAVANAVGSFIFRELSMFVTIVD